MVNCYSGQVKPTVDFHTWLTSYLLVSHELVIFISTFYHPIWNCPQLKCRPYVQGTLHNSPGFARYYLCYKHKHIDGHSQSQLLVTECPLYIY